MDDMENELKRGLNDDNSRQYWLMKAEPESRIVKGVDVKFSIDDLESMPGQTSKWDGVVSYCI
jgi:predicted RNA-binding protein with PUA-like domain